MEVEAVATPVEKPYGGSNMEDVASPVGGFGGRVFGAFWSKQKIQRPHVAAGEYPVMWGSWMQKRGELLEMALFKKMFFKKSTNF